jgi:hypothetical protein
MSLHRVQEAFDDQIRWSRELGSHFMVRLLETCARELGDADSPLHAMIAGWPGNPVADALPIRVAGALHALVLAEQSPELAALYPPNGDEPPSAPLAQAIRRAMRSHPAHFSRYLSNAPQTNEIRRSAVLLPGFAQVVMQTAKPLHLLEIGASAGLNQHWDRFGYQLAGGAVSTGWGLADSPVQLTCELRAAPPPLPSRIEVLSRAACDHAPLDVNNAEHRLRLMSYIWPDQIERKQRLAAAIEMARAQYTPVVQADAAQWVEQQLAMFAARPNRPSTTVLYHSVVWMYLPRAARDRIEAAMQAAAAKASDTHSLAWLRYEFPKAASSAELSLSVWPGRQDQRLARCHPHGAWLEWLASDSNAGSATTK